MFSYIKLLIKIVLVLVFGYPVYVFMMLRALVVIDTITQKGQMICHDGLGEVFHWRTYKAVSVDMFFNLIKKFKSSLAVLSASKQCSSHLHAV